MSQLSYQQRLLSGIQGLSITVSAQQVEQLLCYHQLLLKWNKAYNLTAIREPMAMIDRHLIDSLGVVSFVDAKQLIDVGTGGGMPGVIIAIMCPQVSVTLLDSNGKKTRFLQQVKMQMQLDNITVVQSRLEAYKPEQSFDQITSRAFATLADMVDKSQQLLADNGEYIAMKGQYPHQEIEQLNKDYKVSAVLPLEIPFADGQRHLVRISKASQVSE